MPTNTYVALDKVTVGTATPSITFTGISGAYTDLVIVANHKWSSGTRTSFCMRFNGDTSTANYSDTGLYGTGSSASSGRETGNGYNFCGLISDQWQAMLFQIQNYSNTTTYKTSLSRGNSLGTSGTQNVNAMVHLWSSTAAITSITMFPVSGNIESGSTFSLYGIAASSVGAKATGGDIYTDSQYFYHVFDASGTFTPTQSITADVLVVAGGGGGRGSGGGGGGAGGLLAFTSQSLTATGYTCTVGAGGTGGQSTGATSGANSQFGGLTASVGGGVSGYRTTSNGASGGSGGGGGAWNPGGAGTGGAGTSGQGYAGGNGFSTYYSGGGGGGAGAVGANATISQAGAGGIGATSSLINAIGLATGIGQVSSSNYYLAGGGGAGGSNVTTISYGAGGTGGGGNGSVSNGALGTNGTAFTGAGGGGGWAGTTDSNGGSGGSGVVIVRYLKA